MTIQTARQAVLALLASRGEWATVCPSEVARALANAVGSEDPDDWRYNMPAVHAAVDSLIDQDKTHLSWKGAAGAVSLKRTAPPKMQFDL